MNDKTIRFTKRGVVLSNGLILALAYYLHSQLSTLQDNRCRCASHGAQVQSENPFHATNAVAFHFQ